MLTWLQFTSLHKIQKGNTTVEGVAHDSQKRWKYFHQADLSAILRSYNTNNKAVLGHKTDTVYNCHYLESLELRKGQISLWNPGSRLFLKAAAELEQASYSCAKNLATASSSGKCEWTG